MLPFPHEVTGSRRSEVLRDTAMPDKMNLDDLKLLYCQFQEYEGMIMSTGWSAKKEKHEL